MTIEELKKVLLDKKEQDPGGFHLGHATQLTLIERVEKLSEALESMIETLDDAQRYSFYASKLKEALSKYGKDVEL